MISLRIISRLLEYPDEALWQGQRELLAAVAEASELSSQQQASLIEVIHWRCEGRLLDAQAQYTGLFDRGRSTSLLLFEHVHGESRDRGQAMVNLLEQYRQAGLQLDTYELPDHLPLFLDFLSMGSAKDAVEWLASIAPILALLGARLHERESRYGQLFDLLIQLSGSQAHSKNLMPKVREEARDDTPAALDAVWEEEQVRFMVEQGGCSAEEARQHQRRFSGSVAPQYLDVGAAAPQTRGE
ncbi:nitrate reductase molybdenum cofactor assembly chaperone [Serratia quinivorans]|uniref:nitrate reductase molybdenum cofactor assembly chaperone n=1 Tax=Serratia quinivorans TaxID=137545 RepID=UPI003F967A11